MDNRCKMTIVKYILNFITQEDNRLKVLFQKLG